MSEGAPNIIVADAHHVERWALMRAALWPEESIAEHREEILGLLRHGDDDGVTLLALDTRGEAIGFAEVALRRDYVNGCETSPVVFLEGIFVDPDARRRGVAAALARAAADWGRAKGCTEMASDADIANVASHAFHAAIGFAETERVVYFRRPIG